MSKLKKPGLRKMDAPPTVDLEELDRFAAGAGRDVKAVKRHTSEQGENTYPWEESWVRNDVIKGMGVPLSEPYLLKLQYIAKHTRYSQRGFCREKLEAAIDQEIQALIEEE
jgi:hypothetical protein